MRLENIKEIFTYLNCDNVSYQFLTKDWYMEIIVRLQDTSIRFLVEERPVSSMRKELDLRVVEPSGNSLLASSISFDVGGDLSLIRLMSEYIRRTAALWNKDNRKIVMRDTLVEGEKYTGVYYNSFLGHLHAAGFISTNYFEVPEAEGKRIVVYVEYKDEV